MLQLAQQATLETRDRKHEPRTLTEQRAVWRTEAAETVGGGHEIEAMLRRTLNPPATAAPTVTADWLAQAADRVIAALEEHRSDVQFSLNIRNLYVGVFSADKPKWWSKPIVKLSEEA
jgi:hypothetical protein